MIGILCNSEKEQNYSYELNALFKKLKKYNSPLVVFSIDNINLKDKTFYGNFISEENIKPATLKLPPVIFNFSIQGKNSNIKKVRQIAELEEVALINEANRYNQRTIMEIISSRDDTRKYILPYENINKNSIYIDKGDDTNLLLMPEKGSSISKLIYINGDIAKNLEIENKNPKLIFPKAYSLALKPPKLLTYRGSFPVFRIYLQRSDECTWRILSSSVNLREASKSVDSSIKLQDTSLEIINRVCKFIPSIGCNFIDYIMDNNMNPYFIHLGGFHRILLSSKIESSLKETFLSNLLDFGDFLERQPRR